MSYLYLKEFFKIYLNRVDNNIIKWYYINIENEMRIDKMREHYCANCDYCRRGYEGYEYYCLKWNEETDYFDICWEFSYEE